MKVALLGQDIVVACKLAIIDGRWSERLLASDLFLAQADVHYSLVRLIDARLLDRTDRKIIRRNFTELLHHAVKFIFPASPGSPALGMPTGFACPTIKGHISAGTYGTAVWPDGDGSEYGYTIAPLHKSVPKIAKNDVEMYEILALIDVIREGGARAVGVALPLLDERVRGGAYAGTA